MKKVSAAPSKGGRPPKIVADESTLATLGDLSSLACTIKEAAAVLKIAERTLENFLAANETARTAWDEGHEQAKISVRRKLFKMADGNAAAAIFLAKNLLGMKDVAAIELPVRDLSDDQLDALATALGKTAAAAPGPRRDRAPPTAH